MSSVPIPAARPENRSHELVFVSWNVQGCAGRRGFDPHAVASVLQEAGADIAALQECGTDAEHVHAEAVARSLGFAHVAFGANLEAGAWRYGNALLSRFPLREVRNTRLPGGAEPRGCVTARMELGGVDLVAASAHLGLAARERAEQAREIARLASGDALLLGADGNDWFPGLDTHTFRAAFRDAWRERGTGRRATFPARFPLLRLDHVYVNGDVHVLACEHGDAAHIAKISDHLPVVARVRVAYSQACSPDRVLSSPGSLRSAS